MTNPLTTARTDLAAILAGLDIPVHMYPPGTPTGPFLTILPDSPWLTPRGHVRLQVQVCAPNLNNQSSLERVEQTLSDVLTVLQATPLGVGEISPPTLDPTAGLLTAVVPVLTR
jgi:hypothetical protein